MELQEIRNRLDVIDKQMAELFEKRMDLCAQVARIKAESGKAVYDGQREAQKLAAIYQSPYKLQAPAYSKKMRKNRKRLPKPERPGHDQI